VNGRPAWSFDIQTNGDAVPDRILRAQLPYNCEEEDFEIDERARLDSEQQGSEEVKSKEREDGGCRRKEKAKGKEARDDGRIAEPGNDDWRETIPIAGGDIAKEQKVVAKETRASDQRLILEKAKWLMGG
jgi:hypothetical protein